MISFEDVFTFVVLGRKGCKASAIRRYTKTGLFVENASGILSEWYHDFEN